MTVDLILRPVLDSDLDVFFANQNDPVAIQMAAFTSADPADRAAFDAHWAKIRGLDTVLIRTIVADGVVIGSVLKYEMEGEPEVSYWTARASWGKGIVTRALVRFLDEASQRPMHARVAADNASSIRVLHKCGFEIVGEDRGFANGRGEEIDEYVMTLI
jgi:RimJ/RimL family protein N-acetyltransferase